MPNTDLQNNNDASQEFTHNSEDEQIDAGTDRENKQAADWFSARIGLIEDGDISPLARFVAIWLLAQPLEADIPLGQLHEFLLDDSRPSGHLGLHAVRRALKELETAGYLWRFKLRDERGRWSWDYCVFYAKQNESPQN